MNRIARTNFLTPISSFLTGLGSCLSLAGNYYSYNTSTTPSEADARALYSDWAVIGNDISSAMREIPPAAMKNRGNGE